MDATSSGEPTEPRADDGRGPSRRTVLVSGALAVIAGGGAGVAAAFARPRRIVRPAPVPPAALTEALAAERRLVRLSAGLRPQDALARQLHSDHSAHVRALEAALRDVTGAAAPTTAPASTAAAAAITRAQLRAEEASAAGGAAARAARLRSAPAALLASIAACEAGHAELLA